MRYALCVDLSWWWMTILSEHFIAASEKRFLSLKEKTSNERAVKWNDTYQKSFLISSASAGIIQRLNFLYFFFLFFAYGRKKRCETAYFRYNSWFGIVLVWIVKRVLCALLHRNYFNFHFYCNKLMCAVFFLHSAYNLLHWASDGCLFWLHTNVVFFHWRRLLTVVTFFVFFSSFFFEITSWKWHFYMDAATMSTYHRNVICIQLSSPITARISIATFSLSHFNLYNAKKSQ